MIPVNGINRAVVQAVNFGRSLAPDVRAVFVTTDLEEAEDLRRRWERQFPGVPLVIVESPYRALVGPVVTYLDVLEAAALPDAEVPITIVVLPEYVAKHWWDRVLYNQTAKRLKAALVGPRAHGDRGRAIPPGALRARFPGRAARWRGSRARLLDERRPRGDEHGPGRIGRQQPERHAGERGPGTHPGHELAGVGRPATTTRVASPAATSSIATSSSCRSRPSAVAASTRPRPRSRFHVAPPAKRPGRLGPASCSRRRQGCAGRGHDPIADARARRRSAR